MIIQYHVHIDLQDGKVGDDENDDEMEGAESDEENENDSGDEVMIDIYIDVDG